MRLIAGLMMFAVAAATAMTAQSAPSAPRKIGAEVALMGQWMRTNEQPGQCGCFSLVGGGVEAGVKLSSNWTVLAEGSGLGRQATKNTSNTLTLASVYAGARYHLPVFGEHAQWPRPFAEAMGGVVHAGGTVAGVSDHEYQIGARFGGGFDVPLTRHFDWRMLEADYELTTFANGVNRHQNNLRAASGFVFHW